MGKYMRKSKLTGDVVAVMDVSQSSLGVRTRAKTLALQKLEASKITTTPAPAPEQTSELSYLQLRSRRLEKPPLYMQQNPNPSGGNSRLVIGSGDSASVGSVSGNGNARVFGESQIKLDDETGDYCDLGAEEASFGENNIEFDGRERSTRESTPCSLIKDSSSTPGSSTRPMNRQASNRVTHNSIQRIMPSAQEIEGFFARHVQEQQRRFADKYNFDIVNEKPLQGRYEWVRVQP